MQALQTVEVQPQPHAFQRTERISRKVKVAIDALIEKGLPRHLAADAAGISDHALYKAMQKPPVIAYRLERLRVLRESAAARSIARVDNLADNAVSEHVKLGANELLMGIEGITKVTRSENVHIHQGSIPGLSISFVMAQQAGEQALLIGDQRAGSEKARQINNLPVPVPHPAMGNAALPVSSAGDSRQAKRAGRGVK